MKHLTFSLLLLIGCAHPKPVLTHPVAQFSIPIPCVDGVVGGTDATHCEALPKKTPSAPDRALCTGGVIVQYHCAKSVPK